MDEIMLLEPLTRLTHLFLGHAGYSFLGNSK
jgi:hypothetical protein